MQFVMWQLNERTLALYFDADPPTPAADGSIEMELRSDAPSHLYAAAIDSRDGDRVFRVVVRPRVAIRRRGHGYLERRRGPARRHAVRAG